MRRKWTYEIGLGYESILRDGVMVNKEQAARALNNYESRIAELEEENAMLKQLPQPIKFWSDEKKQIYKINERRTVKSGSEEREE